MLSAIMRNLEVNERDWINKRIQFMSHVIKEPLHLQIIINPEQAACLMVLISAGLDKLTDSKNNQTCGDVLIFANGANLIDKLEQISIKEDDIGNDYQH